MVNEEHDRIEELLAGYVLFGLTGEDALEADRLLSEHVPSCPMCRETMAGFQAVAGELALATPAARPPELLLPRIRRALAEGPVRRRRSAAFVAAAAAVAALVGLAGLSVSLGNRVSKAEAQRGRLLDVMQALQRPGTTPVNLQSQGGQPASGLVEVSGPGLQRMYVFGRDVPVPAPGYAYQLWLGESGTFAPVQNGMFEPDNGVVLLELTVNPSWYDEILITEERVGTMPSTPSSSGHVWHAFLVQAAASA